MSPRAAFLPWIVVLLAALPAASAEKVVLRVPGGRLLHAAENGMLRAESFVPAARETFELVPLAKQQFAVEAALPVQGRVQYQVPGAVSASTGYHVTVLLSAVAEVPLGRSGTDVTVGSPTVLDLNVSLSRLKLSNDLLEAVRREVERFVNRELRHNEGRIREQANRAIDKAISAHEVRIPLLGYLGLL